MVSIFEEIFYNNYRITYIIYP